MMLYVYGAENLDDELYFFCRFILKINQDIKSGIGKIDLKRRQLSNRIRSKGAGVCLEVSNLLVYREEVDLHEDQLIVSHK